MKILVAVLGSALVSISLANLSYAQGVSLKLVGEWAVDIEATTEAYKEMGLSGFLNARIEALQYTGVHRFDEDENFEVELKIGSLRKLEGTYTVTESENDTAILTLEWKTISPGFIHEITAKFMDDRLVWNPDTKTTMIFKRKAAAKKPQEEGDDGKDKQKADQSSDKMPKQGDEK